MLRKLAENWELMAGKLITLKIIYTRSKITNILSIIFIKKNRIRFNNKRGSVVGQLEGEKDKVDQMSLWLKLQGIVNYLLDTYMS